MFVGASGPPLALFDRDGVLIVDKPHQTDTDQISWMPGAAAALRLARAAGFRIAVVTNQSAVARGLCSEADVQAFHRAMAHTLAGKGASVDRWYYCPYHADAVVARYRIAGHRDRKPNPGMVLRALADFAAPPHASFMIGDRMSDLDAARRAGVPGYLYDGGQPLDALVAAIIQDR